jgi:hypothetical protein|tara:strand:- start:9 stop:650 length:642 start_codon:yes stop_codon:yes gene_type:complete
MISLLGGTGKIGSGLAIRFALAGEDVTIGSRNLEQATEVSDKIKGFVNGANITGKKNSDAAKVGDLIFLTIPYVTQKNLLKELENNLENKILVSVVNPYQRVKGEFQSIHLTAGSAAEEAQNQLPKTKVVSAFKNISSDILRDLDSEIDCNTVVCGDDNKSKSEVMNLARKINVEPLDGGRLKGSRQLDAISVLLLNINARYKSNSGFNITGL